MANLSFSSMYAVKRKRSEPSLFPYIADSCTCTVATVFIYYFILLCCAAVQGKHQK